MKNLIYCLVVFSLLSNALFAQVGISTDNSTPDQSAGLDVKFTNKGFLPPRLTTLQRDSIQNPAEGLTIFNTDLKCLEFYAGSSNGWHSPCLSLGTISCSNPVFNGTCMVGIPLTASNTVALTIVNTTSGGYNISTNTVNGIRFSKMGTFTTVGTHVVILNGYGIPDAAGTPTFIVTYGNSNCTFTISVIVPINIPCPGTPTVTYSGQVYNTVQIGNQCWFKENLNVGTRLNGSQSQNPTNGIKEKYCYDNLETNCNIYGGLYQWEEMMQGSTTPGVQGICPSGWHIPTDDEWTILINYLGGDSIAGGKMKESGTIHWTSPNTGADNSSGLKILPAGIYGYNSQFASLNNVTYFWSSTKSNNWINKWCRYLVYNSDDAFRVYAMAYGHSVRCVKDNNAQTSIPTITTNALSSITSLSAVSGGVIIADGGTSITAHGVCWNSAPCPSINNNKTIDSTIIGEFTSNLSGLVSNTTYFVRAYATNSAGTAYGNEVSFTTPPTVTDSDGNLYTSVVIGSQIWMKENLKSIHYSDNSPIPNAYAYNNDEENVPIYGRLYIWSSAMHGAAASNTVPSGIQGACPNSWHLPSYAEWDILINYLGGTAVAGGKMKEIGTTHWVSPNTGATNESSFTALPSGQRYGSGSSFLDLGNNIVMLSSSWAPPANAAVVYIYYNSAEVWNVYLGWDMNDAYSIRCIKD